MCQRLSGCSLKLAAFEKLLTDYANSNGSVVLVQRCIRPGSHVQDEATTSDDLKRMIASINSTSASQKSVLIDYEEVNKILMHERVALWLAADVFLLTCVREGLNLMPLEYIYARKDLENAGVVVASEFSTVSSLLSGALKVRVTFHTSSEFFKYR
jgi:trehalose 6-phosphate synthase/phosphatase